MLFLPSIIDFWTTFKKTMKNKNNLNYDDLCNLIANEVQHKASVDSVKRYLHGLYKVILRQLELNQRI